MYGGEIIARCHVESGFHEIVIKIIGTCSCTLTYVVGKTDGFRETISILENTCESIKYLKSTDSGYFNNDLVNLTADLMIRAYSFVELGNITCYNIICFNMLHAICLVGL